MKGKPFRPLLLLSPSLTAVFLLVIVPICFVVVYSFWLRGLSGQDIPAFQFSNYAKFFVDSFYPSILLNTLLIAPIMIPEVVLGVALLLFIRWLQQPKNFALLLIGHVVLTLPYVLLIVQARLVGIKREYEEAALSLGANPFQTFREITFPLLAPAVLAGMRFARGNNKT